MRASTLLWRLVRFRQVLHHVNAFCIVATIALATVPGLAARSFFDNLEASQIGRAHV